MSEFHTLVVSKEASEVITACDQHARLAHAFWRQLADRRNDDKLAARADECLSSWSRNVSGLFSMFFGGESRITWDGKLSLYVSTSSGFVYGLIFHPGGDFYPSQDGDMVSLCQPGSAVMGRFCSHVEQDVRPFIFCCRALDRDGTCVDHGKQETAWSLPVLGTWSFHS